MIWLPLAALIKTSLACMTGEDGDHRRRFVQSTEQVTEDDVLVYDTETICFGSC